MTGANRTEVHTAAPTVLAGALGRLDPVAPADLPPLLVRTDRKYVVHATTVCDVLDTLGTAIGVLDIDGERSFAYASLYFDTPDRRSFTSSVHGRRQRFKVRVRDYVSQSRRVLEVKTKGRRGVTVKDRLALGSGQTGGAWFGPAAGRRGAVGDEPVGVFGAADAAAAFVDGIVGGGVAKLLGPAVSTYYDRSTLVDRAGGHRITIDTETRGCSPGGVPFSLVCSDLVIVETKSMGPVSAVDRALWQLGHRPMRVSKFGVAMALSCPDLPRNRWHRVIERCSPPLDAAAAGRAAIPFHP